MRGLERALALWTGPALEEFSGEEWADGEIARLTEMHAGTVDDYADELIAARRSAEAVAVLEAPARAVPVPRRLAWPLDPRPRECGSAGRRAPRVPAVPVAADRGARDRAVPRRRPHRAAGRDGLGRHRRRHRRRYAAPIDAVDGPAPERVGARTRAVRRPRRRARTRSPRSSRSVRGSGLRGVVLSGEPGSARPPCWRRSRSRSWRRPTRPSSTGAATRPAYRCNRSAACSPTASSTRRSSSSPSTSRGAAASSRGSARARDAGRDHARTRPCPTTRPSDSSCSRPRPTSCAGSRRRGRSC